MCPIHNGTYTPKRLSDQLFGRYRRFCVSKYFLTIFRHVFLNREDTGFMGTFVNRTCHFVNWDSLDITGAVPLTIRHSFFLIFFNHSIIFCSYLIVNWKNIYLLKYLLILSIHHILSKVEIFIRKNISFFDNNLFS